MARKKLFEYFVFQLGLVWHPNQLLVAQLPSSFVRLLLFLRLRARLSVG